MSLVQDVRFALRMIRKRPAASAIVVLTLGLGIGANGVFFTGFNGMVLNPLPFTEPDRLVALNESQPAIGETWKNVSAANLRDWMDGNPVLAGAGAHRWTSYNFQSSEEPDRIIGAAVTAELFPLLGVQPFLGRGFLPEEDQPDGPLAVLISHDVWTERFASDAAIVGKTLRLDDKVREIVGVMPEGFQFFLYGHLWTPLQLDPAATPRDSRQLEVIARLREGIGVAEAQAAMGAVAERLASLHPATNKGWSVEVRRLHDAWLPRVTQLASTAQMVLVGCVLLIVCANVTNVVLAQATARSQEKALRAALGASRERLIRQTLVESTVLALAGGVLGTMLASWGEVWTRSIVSVPIPYWLKFDLDGRGLLYILAVTLLTGVLIGLLPALKSSGRNLFELLKTGGRLEDTGSGWIRRTLVVAEYAMALVILVGGFLMAKSFHNLESADAGFATEKVLTLRLPLTGDAYDEPKARTAYLTEALRRLDGLAETEAVGAANALPISKNGHMVTALEVDGRSFPENGEPQVVYQTVDDGYFEALSIPRTRGRTFTAGEVTGGADAALVSESLTELLWPGEDPLGRRLRTLRSGAGPWLEVIGVVGDVEPGEMIAGFQSDPRHRVYVPIAGTASSASFDAPPRIPSLVLRSRVEPATLVPAVRRTLRELDPNVPLFEVLAMEEVLTRFYFAQHVWGQMFSAIALLALVIAAVGVYGVTAYSVSRRTREMGIRIAMGASPAQLLALVVRQGLVLAAVGVVLGLVGAVPLAQAMESLLHDMTAIDPGVFAAVMGTLLLVGFVASYLPARRAASSDPIVALRNE